MRPTTLPAKVILGVGMSGNVRTETLRLFDEQETDAIVEAV